MKKVRRMSTDMTAQAVLVFMVYQAHIAIRAFGNPITDFTFQTWRKSSSILEKNHLLFLLDSAFDILHHERGEMTVHGLAMGFFFQVADKHFGEPSFAITLAKCHQTILAMCGIIISFYGRGGRS